MPNCLSVATADLAGGNAYATSFLVNSNSMSHDNEFEAKARLAQDELVATRMRRSPQRATKTESDVFAELAALCTSPGYVHALAYICHKDNFITYEKEMKVADMQKLFTHSRLIRTEISTLIGLMVQKEIDWQLPAPAAMQEYIDRTYRLLDELHAAIGLPLFDSIKAIGNSGSPLGSFLREPIFYGGESAYSFQYRDFSVEKYDQDEEWLCRNKGFTIQAAAAVVRAIGEIQNKNVIATHKAMLKTPSANWTILPGFCLSAEDVESISGVSLEEVKAVLNAFTLQDRNPCFGDASAFNSVAATPLLPLPDGRVLLLQYYSIVEALYESPFYWMGSDDAYKAIAFKHRGEFTESFVVRRLTKVFGTANVMSNVDLFQGRNKAGEIDVMVTFGDRLIVVQAKSKRLTLEARKGNDGQIKADFQKAITDSYEQGLLCARHLLAGDCVLRSPQGSEIKILRKPKEVFILNVVSDHYPALSFQARQFLKHEVSEGIRPPFIMDIFLLDAMTEMLETPLRLLSYVNQRAMQADKLLIQHELVALSFHLKENLWLSDENDMVHLGDDISVDLDLAMTVRREGIPGNRTPDGILTRFAGTAFERLIRQIEQRGDPATIELGFLLLTLGEDTCRHIDNGIREVTRLARTDGAVHDFTVSIGAAQEGICIHCNIGESDAAAKKLAAHCHLRKYTLNASKWFGLCLDTDERIRMGVVLDYPWCQSDEMDAQTAGMQRRPGINIKGLAAKWGNGKIGRNDPCPCGSGLKYKKCHLGKSN